MGLILQMGKGVSFIIIPFSDNQSTWHVLQYDLPNSTCQTFSASYHCLLLQMHGFWPGRGVIGSAPKTHGPK